MIFRIFAPIIFIFWGFISGIEFSFNPKKGLKRLEWIKNTVEWGIKNNKV